MLKHLNRNTVIKHSNKFKYGNNNIIVSILLLYADKGKIVGTLVEDVPNPVRADNQNLVESCSSAAIKMKFSSTRSFQGVAVVFLNK